VDDDRKQLAPAECVLSQSAISGSSPGMITLALEKDDESTSGGLSSVVTPFIRATWLPFRVPVETRGTSTLASVPRASFAM